MSFQSLGFLLGVAVTVAVCRMAALIYDWQAHLQPWPADPANERFVHRNAQLLGLISLIFYLLYTMGPRADATQLGVPLAGMLVSWGAARRMQSGAGNRRRCFVLAAVWHVGVLAFYKYAGPLTGGAVTAPPVPVGLSFFTFQQLWLLAEVYRGNFALGREERSGFLLYSMFFPTVTSGPILKPQGFFSQLRERIILASARDFAAGLYAISLGMAKKVLLADPIGAVVANGWALGDARTAPAAWIVILGYTLQLYLDFSGYCDIAAGCARLLGLRLPVNFDAPYRARSVGEFWKRWHITLTTFLRECVYFPLGGSRRGTARTCANILIVYLISGLWHGTGWTFLVWGLLHGLAQAAERLLGRRLERAPGAVRWALTFLFVNLAWVFFQAPSLSAAGDLLASAAAGGWGLPLETLAAGALDSEAAALRTLLPALEGAVPAILVLGLLGIGLAVSLRRENVIRRMETFRPTPVRALACGGALVWAVTSFSSTATFIYSNF